jgi:hypothetical protein
MADKKTFIKHSTLGSLLSPVYCRGIIKKIDYKKDTCDVEVEIILDANGLTKKLYEKVPFYYHCDNDVEEREVEGDPENKALYGGATAFDIDDRVIIVAIRKDNGSGKKWDYKLLKVVGFQDKDKDKKDQDKKGCVYCKGAIFNEKYYAYNSNSSVEARSKMRYTVIPPRYDIIEDAVTTITPGDYPSHYTTFNFNKSFKFSRIIIPTDLVEIVCTVDISKASMELWTLFVAISNIPNIYLIADTMWLTGPYVYGITDTGRPYVPDLTFGSKFKIVNCLPYGTWMTPSDVITVFLGQAYTRYSHDISAGITITLDSVAVYGITDNPSNPWITEVVGILPIPKKDGVA